MTRTAADQHGRILEFVIPQRTDGRPAVPYGVALYLNPDGTTDLWGIDIDLIPNQTTTPHHHQEDTP